MVRIKGRGAKSRSSFGSGGRPSVIHSTLAKEETLMSDMMVVSSKIKKFVREKAGFNTSAETLEALSQRVERLCAEAIERARADGRKTVKARDVV
jgi:histone H3/H4